MKLTEHFDLSEFMRSATADRLHIDNSIDLTVPSGQSVFGNLKNLCEQVLEPLRCHFGVPVIISSGYRCTALNRAVGGVRNSQHLTGEAVDIVPEQRKENKGPKTEVSGQMTEEGGRKSENGEILKDWFLWLQDNTHFDQLIMEKKGSSRWIHVSCKLDLNKNRQVVKDLQPFL